ncbi:MAG: Fe-S-binding domain-containing protein, partial [Acidobacteria bacterium]
GDDHKFIRIIALIVSLAEFLFSLLMIRAVPVGATGYHLEEYAKWIDQPPIHYHLGVDGISLFLVILTTFLTPISILASWQSIEHRVKEFFVMLLMLELGVVGVFLSLDLFLFFLFWEVMLIPMAFLIGIWGHERRVYAAVKFVLYTMAGSILMLVGIIWLYNATGTFDLPTVEALLHTPLSQGGLELAPRTEMLLFLAFFLAFAIKVPLFPLHTWLPDAHVEAPTAGSVMLAGVLLKMGTYGMIRFCLPGMSTGALFLLVGMLHDRRHTFEISEYGGLATPMPKLAAFFLFVALSSLGLPMLNGFVGEYLVLLGTYQRHWGWASWAALGVILSACYLLWSYQRVFFGEITREKNRTLPDVSAREKWILATMAIVTLWMGVGSTFITARTAAAAQSVIDEVEPQRPYEAATPDSATPQAKLDSSGAAKAISSERLGIR